MYSDNSILTINNFSLSFLMNKKNAFAVKNISLNINKGEMVALVGESGCGKTLTALSCMGLQPENAVVEGSIEAEGKNILHFSEKEWDFYRGNKVSMIFQEPTTSLDPLVTAGKQIAETGEIHGLDPMDAKRKALDLMNQVNLTDAEHLYNSYPHQLSGGQQQRVMIASALMNNPDLIIADEPTTALDVTTQAQIMELLKKMNTELRTAVFLITHDLLLVERMCSRVYIMYAGTILECGPTQEVLQNPVHPYTKALLGALPSKTEKNKRLSILPGCVPSISRRSESTACLYERWPDAKNRCYLHENAKSSGSHKVYCHVHQTLENI